MKKVLATAAAALLVAAASAAAASTVTFETAPVGPGFAGPVSEDGVTYQNSGGGLFVATDGHPGQDLEGTVADGGGVATFTPTAGGQFTFTSLDYGAYSYAETDARGGPDYPGETETLTVTGLLNGAVVGTDQFSLAATDQAADDGSIANFTTFAADNLAGLNIDTLQINLQAGGFPIDYFFEAVDNVSFGPAATDGAVPEPASWALMLSGFGLVGIGLRRRAGRMVQAV